MAFLAQDSWEFFLQLARRDGITPFPHIDISPDQMVLADRHATHNTDSNGFGLDFALCTHITLHNNSSSYLVSQRRIFCILIPSRITFPRNKSEHISSVPAITGKDKRIVENNQDDHSHIFVPSERPNLKSKMSSGANSARQIIIQK